jgi:hypothetical protein
VTHGGFFVTPDRQGHNPPWVVRTAEPFIVDEAVDCLSFGRAWFS